MSAPYFFVIGEMSKITCLILSPYEGKIIDSARRRHDGMAA